MTQQHGEDMCDGGEAGCGRLCWVSDLRRGICVTDRRNRPSACSAAGLAEGEYGFGLVACMQGEWKTRFEPWESVNTSSHMIQTFDGVTLLGE